MARHQSFDDASVTFRSVRLLDRRDVGTRILPQGPAGLGERFGLIPGVYVEAVLQADVVEHGNLGKETRSP